MSNRSKRAAIVSFDSQRPRANRIHQSDSEPEESNNEEQEVLISNCVRYILLREHSKNIIKQADINKFLTENHVVNRNEIANIMLEVKKRLFNIFGYRLVDCPDLKVKSYILHTIYNMREICLDDEDEIISSYFTNSDVIEHDVEECQDGNASDVDTSSASFHDDLVENLNENLNIDDMIANSKRSLLLIVLSLIFMNEDPLPEKDLFKSIKDLGLNIDEKIETCHDTPKYTVKKLLTDEFVHKGYFRRIKIKNHDPSEETQYEYDWGIRAVVEFKKTDVLNFVKRVYQMDDTALWQRFEKKATQEDQKRQAMICGNTERGPSQLVEEEEMVIEEAPMEQSGESPPVVKKGRRKAQLFNSQPELFSDSGSQRITRSSASGSSSQTPVTKKAKNAKQSTAKKQTVEKKCVPKRGSVVKHYDSPVQRLRKKK